MNTAPSNRPAEGFTLVEMLVVIAIIALLAALLLPALTASEMRAKRIACESQLRQIGIGFQVFAHDHDGKYPMQVPAGDGGSREFTLSGYRVNGPFYFSYRHFQPLAGALQTPAVLICPADTRLAATNFAALLNSNVSYFVSVTADYSQPMTLLAGDRNLAAPATLVRAAPGARLTWTAALHRFKGNVLFSDGHVEEWSDHGADTLASGGNLVLPSVVADSAPAGDASSSATPSGNAAASTAVSSGATQANSNSEGNQSTSLAATNSPALPPPTIARGGEMEPVFSAGSESSNANQIAAKISANSNGPAARGSHPADEDSTMSSANRKVAGLLRDGLLGCYLLAVFLCLLFAARRAWRRVILAQKRRNADAGFDAE